MAQRPHESAEYDIGLAVKQYEQSDTLMRRAGRIGSRVLQVYSLTEMGIRVGLSVAALTGSLFATHSHDTTTPPNTGISNGWSNNTSWSTGDITVNNNNMGVYGSSEGTVTNNASTDIVVAAANNGG